MPIVLEGQKRRGRSWRNQTGYMEEYKRVCKRLLSILGRTIPVEEIADQSLHGTTYRTSQTDYQPCNATQRTGKAQGVVCWAYDADHVDQPLRYRDALERPPKQPSG